MSSKHIARIMILVAGLVTMRVEAATDPPKPDKSGKATDQKAPPPPAPGMPVYKPPVGLGLPGGRVGGGTRGVDMSFVLAVLAPNHTGLTIQEQPVLYWYVSKPLSSPLEFTLTDDGIKPLLETRLSPPFEPGVHRLPLMDYGMKLAPGKKYRWFVALVVDTERRSRDVLAGGSIQRVDPGEGLATAITQAGAAQRPFIYAEAGMWYDAIQAISTLIEAAPNDATLRNQRAALLQQAELSGIAKYDITLTQAK